MNAAWKEDPALRDVLAAAETCWINPEKKPFAAVADGLPVKPGEVDDAADRLDRFAPLLRSLFPETEADCGRIESPLRELPALREKLSWRERVPAGRLFLKLDSELAVAGSVKARGGIYEVLKHTEELALEAGLLRPDGNYAALAQQRDFFAKYTVQVGSTGNLGLSIGIMAAALGYRAVVHMSADARQWKKDLLRQKGVDVREYDGDYGKAVEQGRALSDADSMSYFVDDEHSKNLFFGYAVAARRLAEQLAAQDVEVDDDHPLFVTIPCGVGGAPGGVAYGLKLLYGDNVHVFFAEPVQCPCMLLGLATGEKDGVCVQDAGLTGVTEADGLAVARPSKLVCDVMEYTLSGEFTVADGRLYEDLRALHAAEKLFIEPSACAAFAGYRGLARFPAAQSYLKAHGLIGKMENASHILWATGGRLVPALTRKEYLAKRL
ncbi:MULTISPECIES: D-serine ammonia-lyase [unclassified Oscillibacter]|uniref:D-serine ammonia-lyase n=1 Tax=unclassified Oscillibacter TaxID=2629304 RepID=UPI0025F47DDE|nr:MULTISPECIES: D-serine ammonia-lyase [unclassified Oscillibacter]